MILRFLFLGSRRPTDLRHLNRSWIKSQHHPPLSDNAQTGRPSRAVQVPQIPAGHRRAAVSKASHRQTPRPSRPGGRTSQPVHTRSSSLPLRTHALHHLQELRIRSRCTPAWRSSKGRASCTWRECAAIRQDSMRSTWACAWARGCQRTAPRTAK